MAHRRHMKIANIYNHIFREDDLFRATHLILNNCYLTARESGLEDIQILKPKL